MDPFTKINFMRPSFFKDLSIPAVAAPMFLISCPKLVIECCKKGVVGTLPALNQKTTKGFEEWIIDSFKGSEDLWSLPDLTKMERFENFRRSIRKK